MAEEFLIGINYWPRKKGMRWWERFDIGEAREELAMMASVGVKVVRFFLLWESFMPTPREVSAEKLGHLVAFVDAVAEAGMSAQPTFFTGHMSGPNWAPAWLYTEQPVGKGEKQNLSLTDLNKPGNRIHNIYTTPWVVEAEGIKIAAVCGALRGHSGVWGYSLGNEPDLFCKPPTASIGRAWMRARVSEIRAAAGVGPRTLIGLHTASLDGDPGLRVNDAAAETDVSVMHGYSMFSQVARHKLDPDYVPFANALTAALAGRPVLFEEFGICCWDPTLGDGAARSASMPRWDGTVRTEFIASEEQAAEYYEGVLSRLHRVGALGAFAWGFMSYDPAIWHEEPCLRQTHERYFGIFRADGTLRPMGQVLKEFAARAPRVRQPERVVELGMTPEAYYADALANQRRLYARWGSL
jgi:hypothetical protein